MNPLNFFTELKRRRVYNVAVAYAVIAWLLIQVATQTFPFLNVPNWATRLVILLLVAGFPLALVLSWAFELTPEGVRRVLPNGGEPVRRGASRKLVAVIAIFASVALGMFLFRVSRPQPETPDEPSTPTLIGISPKSIAVLPFDNLSIDQENAFFVEGVKNEILTHLSKIADLKVISRTSTAYYKSGAPRNLREIVRQLGVAHILEGSVQREANRVRVTAQLIDGRTDSQLWADRYDRDLADIFAIQSEIASAIAEQLKATLSSREKAEIARAPTRDLAAYDLYVEAQALASDATNQTQAEAKLPRAATLLDESLKHDPSFIRARCLLSRIHGQMYWAGFDHTPERLALVKAAVEAALRIDSEAGEAHLALADYYYRGFRDYKQARRELAIAQRTLPNDPQLFEYTGYIERRQGHWEEATQNLERALELDPRNFQTIQQLALTYQLQRRYADELAAYDRALRLVPHDSQTLTLRAWVQADWRADLEPFRTTLETLLAKDPTSAADIDDINYALCERTVAAVTRSLGHYSSEGAVYNGVRFPRTYWEGVVARWQGEPEKARAAFSDARREVQSVLAKQPDFPAGLSLLGLIKAGLELKDEAVSDGRRACELLPVSVDAVDGVAYAVNLAQIYTWTGEKNLAIEQLATVAQSPNFLSYGYLKLQPIWDPLRGDPRFEKIVADLAPKP